MRHASILELLRNCYALGPSDRHESTIGGHPAGSVYVPIDKIDLIPHGIPDLPFTDPNFYKDALGTEGKDVLLTFGLLSPNKGIENVIQALPTILSRHNNVVYIVSGVTHPHILRCEGDKYRIYLQTLAKDLGVEANVIFRDRFVSPEELVELIGAADIYITPYKHKGQVVSGTLAYALCLPHVLFRNRMLPIPEPTSGREVYIERWGTGCALRIRWSRSSEG